MRLERVGQAGYGLVLQHESHACMHAGSELAHSTMEVVVAAAVAATTNLSSPTS